MGSTYVLTTRHIVIHPETQREMAAHAERVVEIGRTHVPQADHPDLLADLLASAAG